MSWPERTYTDLGNRIVGGPWPDPPSVDREREQRAAGVLTGIGSAQRAWERLVAGALAPELDGARPRTFVWQRYGPCGWCDGSGRTPDGWCGNHGPWPQGPLHRDRLPPLAAMPRIAGLARVMERAEQLAGELCDRMEAVRIPCTRATDWHLFDEEEGGFFPGGRALTGAMHAFYEAPETRRIGQALHELGIVASLPGGGAVALSLRAPLGGT